MKALVTLRGGKEIMIDGNVGEIHDFLKLRFSSSEAKLKKRGRGRPRLSPNSHKGICPICDKGFYGKSKTCRRLICVSTIKGRRSHAAWDRYSPEEKKERVEKQVSIRLANRKERI